MFSFVEFYGFRLVFIKRIPLAIRLARTFYGFINRCPYELIFQRKAINLRNNFIKKKFLDGHYQKYISLALKKLYYADEFTLKLSFPRLKCNPPLKHINPKRKSSSI